MKKIIISLLLIIVLSCGGCSDNSKVIRVCASELPHAEILNNCVKDILERQGYKLEVTILDWTMQNDSVASGDYDANYFQHIPYLSTYNGATELVATSKVHYEPLGIYAGKSTGALSSGKTFAICNDESNAVRAFRLLLDKNVLTNAPITDEGKLTISGSSWTSDNNVTVTLISEELLVASMSDYDFVCLPCNTAYTGNVDSQKLITNETDKTLVSTNANVLAVRKLDYLNDLEYQTKIDLLTDALLSSEVAEYVNTQYHQFITCNPDSQIDLRDLIK